MSCPGRDQIAAAAAGEDSETAEHALGCAACSEALDDQRAIRRQLAALVKPPLLAAERERIAAGLMAQLDAKLESRRGGRRSSAVRGGLLAAAAVLVIGAMGLLIGARQPPADANRTARGNGSASPEAPPQVPPAPTVAVAETTKPATPVVAEPASRKLASATPNIGARFVREIGTDHDIIELSDGEITIDARDTAPTVVRLAGTAIRVADAKVTVRAKRGALAMVSVFAGSVEMASGAKSTVVSAGTIWEAPAEPPPAPPAPAIHDAESSLAAFRDGWNALRDGRYGVAIEAFDRARSPVIHEDAAYWAAVAASRAGFHKLSRRRFELFLSKFPDSPWAEAALRASRETAP